MKKAGGMKKLFMDCGQHEDGCWWGIAKDSVGTIDFAITHVSKKQLFNWAKNIGYFFETIFG